MSTEPTEQHKTEARKIVDESICRLHARSLANTEDVLVVRHTLESRIVSIIASRDTEVREVLEGLGSHTDGVHCWCWKPRLSKLLDFHEDQCLAARALWLKLQPVKEGKDA